MGRSQKHLQQGWKRGRRERVSRGRSEKNGAGAESDLKTLTVASYGWQKAKLSSLAHWGLCWQSTGWLCIANWPGDRRTSTATTHKSCPPEPLVAWDHRPSQLVEAGTTKTTYFVLGKRAITWGSRESSIIEAVRTECLCPPSLVHMLKSNPECDGMRRWGFGEVIRSWECGWRDQTCAFLPCEHTAKREPSVNQKVGFHQTPNLSAHRCWPSQSPELNCVK